MKVIVGLKPSAVSSVTPDYVSLAKYNHLTVIINHLNGADTVATAVTLKQAKTNEGGDAKALGFTKKYGNADVSASDLLTIADVTSDTFDAGGVSGKNSLEIIEIDADSLDVSNGFEYVTVELADNANATASVIYILSNPRYNSYEDFGGQSAI